MVKWCMHKQAGARGGRNGKARAERGQARAGDPGTWVPRLAVAVGGAPNTSSRLCQGPQLWGGGVRGKPNELKRLDVPVPVPTSRPPLAIRNESATRAGTACSFYQGWLGSTVLTCVYHPDPFLPSPSNSNSKSNSKSSFHQPAAGSQQPAAFLQGPSKHRLKPAQPAAQSITHSQGLSAFICIAPAHPIAFCIVPHCVAVSLPPVSVSLRLFFLQDRYTLVVPINTRPASFFPPSRPPLSISPHLASPPILNALDAISRAQHYLDSFPSLSLTLCSSDSLVSLSLLFLALGAHNVETLAIVLIQSTPSSWSLSISRPRQPHQ